MKRCPTCDKTFEDSMRFCQTDGTPLVEDAPAFDPYATVVAPRIEEPVAADPPAMSAEPAASEPVGIDDFAVELTAAEPSAPAIAEPEEVLDLPQSDPLKTMYVSEDEMRAALGGVSEPEEPIMEVPEAAVPEPPQFAEPEIAPPSFGSVAPPPSPFASADEPAAPAAKFQASVPPIPSPFDAGAPAAVEPEAAEPETVIQTEPPVFQVPEPVFTPTPEPVAYKDPEPPAPSFANPFEQASTPAEWTPPPAPDASWQNQPIGQNTPFQPPVAGGSKNQTLPIVSLILGIVSLCCYISPLTGLGALITGFMGMKNANNDPDNYGGKGLAIAGMIVGGIFMLIGVAYYVIIILMYAGIIAGSMLQGY